MRVFLSSTIYDLLDVRAEVYDVLASLVDMHLGWFDLAKLAIENPDTVLTLGEHAP